MIIVNFKRYPEASGEKAIRLAQICHQLSGKFGLQIIPVPVAADLITINRSGIDCWTQKFEPDLTQSCGSLLNHSDFRIENKQELQEEIYLSKSRGDKVCLCTQTPEETVEYLSFKPDFLAYEPPELIGSKITSVAQAEPEVIGKAARACKEAGIPLLVGAGIKSAQDVRVSLKQGATGILVASAVVLAQDQEQKLRELAEAFK